MHIVIFSSPKSLKPIDEVESPLVDAASAAVSCLDSGKAACVTSENELTAELDRGTDVLVIAAAHVDDRQIGRIRALRPPPIVVVSRDPAATALTLRRVVVQEIVKAEPEVVAEAIQRQAGGALLIRTARVVEAHPQLSSGARRWMLLTLRARPPYRSVGAASKSLQRSRGTINRWWRSSVDVSSPKEWLTWIQFTRALQCWRGTGPYERVAEQLQISPRTLNRITRRLVGRRFSALDAESDEPLRRANQYFARLLGTG